MYVCMYVCMYVLLSYGWAGNVFPRLDTACGVQGQAGAVCNDPGSGSSFLPWAVPSLGENCEII